VRSWLKGIVLHTRYQSLQHLSLSEATTLGFLGPIATGILGYLVLREPYTRREAAAGGESSLPQLSLRGGSTDHPVCMNGLRHVIQPSPLLASSSSPAQHSSSARLHGYRTVSQSRPTGVTRSPQGRELAGTTRSMTRIRER
jgi:hypothetical protein